MTKKFVCLVPKEFTMKKLRYFIIFGLLIGGFPLAAEASFVEYWKCVKEAAKLENPERTLKGLDCAVALAKEIKEEIISFNYMPTLDPDDIFLADLNSSPGAELLALNPSDSYEFGNAMDYTTLLADNSYNDPTDLFNVELTALDINTFASFAVAATEAEQMGDLSVAFENPLWSTDGFQMFDGSPASIEVNTSGLNHGQFIIRTKVSDNINGDPIYGLSFVQVVSEPPIAFIFCVTLLLFIAFHRRKKRGNFSTDL